MKRDEGIERLIDRLDERAVRLFALECAETVLGLFERTCPTDGRPREAIEASRRSIVGEAAGEEVTMAGFAAWEAARDTFSFASGSPAAGWAADVAAAAAAASIPQEPGEAVAVARLAARDASMWTREARTAAVRAESRVASWEAHRTAAGIESWAEAWASAGKAVWDAARHAENVAVSEADNAERNRQIKRLNELGLE